MVIHVDYQATVPDELKKNDFCSTRDRKKCAGIQNDLFHYPSYCNRFSVQLEMYLGRYKKCEACKAACAEALTNKR